MKLVKIILGTYGYKPKGALSVKPISAGGTIEVSDAEVERLIALKVATAVSDDEVTAAVHALQLAGQSGVENEAEREMKAIADVTEDEGGDAEGSGDSEDENEADDTESVDLSDRIPEYSADMSLDELKDIFKDCDLPYRVGMSKVNMVAALDRHFAVDDSDESLPVLSTEDPVT